MNERIDYYTSASPPYLDIVSKFLYWKYGKTRKFRLSYLYWSYAITDDHFEEDDVPAGLIRGKMILRIL